MRKRLQASKATYENYEKWYDKYEKNVQMRSPKFSEAEFNKWYRDAKYMQSKITDPKERKNFMRNFSQVLARKQRQASELQLRVTWTAIKEVSSQIGVNIKRTEDLYVRKLLREDIMRRNKKLSIGEVEDEVERLFNEGASDKILKMAKEMTAEKMSKEINVLETYKDLDWKTFKREQKEILQKYYGLFGKEHRYIWDEAFSIYYEKGLNKRK